MKSLSVLALLLALSSVSLPAQRHSKKNSAPSAAFNNARYVYVRAEDGDITRPNLFPEDREAIGDVMDGIRDWKRYVLVTTPGDADLIFVVRKGRLASVQGTAGGSLGSSVPRVSTGSRNPSSVQDPATDDIGARAEVGPPDDMLRVFLPNGDGKRETPIWTGRQDDGLEPPTSRCSGNSASPSNRPTRSIHQPSPRNRDTCPHGHGSRPRAARPTSDPVAPTARL